MVDAVVAAEVLLEVPRCRALLIGTSETSSDAAASPAQGACRAATPLPMIFLWLDYGMVNTGL